MGETIADTPTTSKSKPTITVPPRGTVGFFLANGSASGFSPGPMTLVSSFFPEQTPFSFSQLLAMASPLTPKTAFLPTYDSRKLEPSSLPMTPHPQPEGLSSPLFVGMMNSPAYLSPLHSPFGMSHQQALAHVTAQAALSQSFKQMQADYHHSSSTNIGQVVPNTSSPEKPSNLELESSKKESSDVSKSDKKTVNDKPANDGYNWRKYGQKQVKASECPRSYYKCTHLNCPVRKKVERSLDGSVSEITYKGQHNHDPPKPNKREKDSSVSDRPTQSKPVSSETERLNEAVIVNSATSHPVVSCNDNTRDNAVVVADEDAPEPIAKRRSLDTGASVPTSSSQKAVTDTKVVLQTRSAVDLLDDGFKWRKYGQKVVKGNSHPRSYYRCTYAGCNVRKHVERASADPKSVITTYEGKHNHDFPGGRYSSSTASGSAQAQKMISKNPSIDKEIDSGNNDQIPTTLQLKEADIAS